MSDYDTQLQQQVDSYDAPPVDFRPDAPPKPAAPAPATSLLAARTPTLDEQVDNYAPPAPAGTPLKAQATAYDFPKAITESVTPYFQQIGRDLEIGTEGVKQSLVGGQAASGLINYEDAEALLAQDKVRGADLNNQSNEFINHAGPIAQIYGFTRPAVQSLPYLAALAAQTWTGAAVGAAAGAIAGPGSLVTAALGGEAYAATSMFYTGMGDAYMDLRRNGLDHETARNWSYAAGAVNGILGSLRLKQVSSATNQMIAKALIRNVESDAAGAASRALAKGVSQKIEDEQGYMLVNAMKQFSKTAAFQTQVGATQAVANATMKAASMFAAGKELRPKDVVAEMHQASIAAAQQAITLGAAHAATSTVVGQVLKKPPTDVQSTLEIMALKAEQPQLDMQAILDKHEMYKARIEKKHYSAEEDLDQLVAENVKRPQSQLENRKSLVRIIKAALPPELQGQVMSHIAHVTTEGKLDKAVAKLRVDIPKVLETSRKKAALEELKTVLKDADPRSGKSRFEHDSLYQETMDRIKQFVDDPELAAKAEQDYHDALAERDAKIHRGETVTGEEHASIADKHYDYLLAEIVGDVKAKKSKEVFDLAAEIRLLAKTGISKKLLKVKHDKQLGIELGQKLEQGVQGNKKVDTKNITGDKTNTDRHITNPFRWVDAFISSLPGKLRIALQDSPKAFREQLIKHFDIDQNANQVRELRSQGVDRLMDCLIKAMGKKKSRVLKYITTAPKKTIKFRYWDANGEVATFEGNLSEAIDVYANIQDETLQKGHVIGNRYTGEFLQIDLKALQVELDNAHPGTKSYEAKAEFLKRAEKANDIGTRGEVLDPKSNELLDSFENTLREKIGTDGENAAKGVKEFYKDQGERLARLYKEETGLTLDLGENYAGKVSRDRTFAEAADASDSLAASLQGAVKRGFQSTNASKPKSVISRRDSALPIEAESFFGKAVKAVNDTAHYEAYKDVMKPIAIALGNAGFRKATSLKFGGKSGLLAMIENHYKDAVHGGSYAVDGWNNFSNWILSKAGFAVLALKPLQYFKQRGATINFLLDIPTKDFIVGVGKFHLHEGKYKKLFADILKRRYDSFNEVLTGAESKGVYADIEQHRIKEFLMKPLILGDRDAILPGMAAVYEFAKKNGASEPEALAAAEKSLHTQGSNNIAQLSDASRNPVLKTLTIFQQQPTRMFEFVMDSVRTFSNDPSDSNFKNMVKVIAVAHISQALFASVNLGWRVGVNQLFNKGQQDLESAGWDFAKELILGPLPFVLNDFAHALASTAIIGGTKIASDAGLPIQGQSIQTQHIDEIQSIPIQAGWYSIKLFGEALKDLGNELNGNDYDREDALLRLGQDYSRGPNFLWGGLPLQPVLSIMKTLKEAKDAGLLSQ